MTVRRVARSAAAWPASGISFTCATIFTNGDHTVALRCRAGSRAPPSARGRKVVHTLHAHSVFTPEYRRGSFTDEILRRREEVMRDVCADFETEPVEFNGEFRERKRPRGPGVRSSGASAFGYAGIQA
ncbi:transposase [Streptomyces sp. NPDC001584]|uniref:transposase n=1 Tax=Streptomyces sp. NPDC001584 TaxID=3154521 RepID=UPI0033251480